MAISYIDIVFASEKKEDITQDMPDPAPVPVVSKVVRTLVKALK